MSLVDELRRLKELHDANALTTEEFAQAKLLLLQGDLSGDTPGNAPAVAAEPVPESTPYQAIESVVAEMVTQLDDSRSQPEPIETTPPVQQPEPARNVPAPNPLAGIRGWLVWLAIGRIIGPVQYAALCFGCAYTLHWLDDTSLRLLFVFDLLLFGAFAVVELELSSLFFKKSWRFPERYRQLFVAQTIVAWISVMVLLTQIIDWRHVLEVAGGTLIGIYMCSVIGRSKRVQATFVHDHKTPFAFYPITGIALLVVGIGVDATLSSERDTRVAEQRASRITPSDSRDQFPEPPKQAPTPSRDSFTEPPQKLPADRETYSDIAVPSGVVQASAEMPQVLSASDQALFRRARQGDAEAQSNLGDMYFNKDNAEAVEWYRKAAEQGDAYSMIKLTDMYRNGRGVPKDQAEAVKWYRKAAETGRPYVQYGLGNMYRTGKGIPKDVTEAMKWYRKAAEQGNAFAQYNLGEMYRTGEGVPQDDAEAVKWYSKVAEQGLAKAQFILGGMYDFGRGVPEDKAEAVTWYRKAAEQGNTDAQNNLGVMYANGDGVPADHVESYAWLSVAVTNGHEGAKEGLPVVKAQLAPEQLIDAQKRATELYKQINANKAKLRFSP